MTGSLSMRNARKRQRERTKLDDPELYQHQLEEMKRLRRALAAKRKAEKTGV